MSIVIALATDLWFHLYEYFVSCTVMLFLSTAIELIVRVADIYKCNCSGSTKDEILNFIRM